MMGSELINFVEALNGCISGSYLIKDSEAKRNVTNIRGYFEVERTRTDLDGAFATLFDKKTGILPFIQRAMKQDSFVVSIKESFLLLKELIDFFKERMSCHVLRIKDLCKTCILLDKKAEEKDKAFDVLQSILENGPWSDDLNVNELFDKLIDPFKNNKSNVMPAKVIQKHLHILGVIVRRYPECLKREETSLLLRIYLSQLEMQTRLASAVKYQIIAGCLSGLTEFLYVFPLNPEEKEGKKIYDCMTAVAQKHGEMRVAPRAALGLIQAHGCQLAKFLYDKYKFWHEFLQTWVQSAGEDHKAGVGALDMFYNQIALILKDNKSETGRSVFLYFITSFKEMLNRGTSSYDIKLAIKAFGLFAAPCHIFMDSQDVVQMFTVVMQRAEQIYFKEEDVSNMDLQNLPHYIESLSSIIMQLMNVTNERLVALQYLTVLLIENFPKLPKPFHWLAIRAIIVTLCNLAECGGTYLDDFLSNMVYQGVIRSCKHQITIDVELQKGQFQRNPITYRDYIPLWMALLSVQKFQGKSTSLAQTQLIVIKVYDELIRTVLALLKKLDLSIRKKINIEALSTSDRSGEEDVPVLDPESGLQANNCKDFQVFINLVDLMRDVLISADCVQFEKWIQPFCYQVISESSHKPLVSGFYKLLTMALQLCDRLHYFDDCKDMQSQTNEQRACYTLLCRFLQELLIRLQQYKNDLQVACLQTVIAAPTVLIVPLLPHAAPAFEAIFRVGRSMLPLARLGISALDKWYSTLPSHLMKPLLVQVLPHLDPFLRSKGMGSDEDMIIEMELLALGRRNRANVSKNRKVVRKNAERTDSELSQLQHDIISFLGQLDSTTCLALLKEPQKEEDSVPWAKCLEQPLEFPLPFKDMKLDIKLEKLVPRVVELALTSSDRYTRFTACELLHAIIMFMLGRSQGAQTSDKYSELFKKLSLPLLKLGCDPDPAIHRLYNLLVLQLVHWYSSKFKLKSKETEILIQTLMDGITHSTDTALRDFSSRCLHEFVVWSVKQDSHVNIKAIMKQIYSFCLHPCPSKRLGAALILNSVYTVLREKESVVNEYWLELLYHMVVNLSLSEETDSILGSHEQVVTALNHIERVLKEKASLFNKDDKRRRKPPEFEGILLKDAVSWLLLKCGSTQVECRHKCMELVYVLAQLLPDCRSGSEFVTWYVTSHTWMSLLKVCEGSVESGGIAVTPTLKDFRNEVALAHVVRWLHMILTSLDCYIWLFGEGLVRPSLLLKTESLGNMSKARIFEAAAYFIKYVSHHDARHVTRLLSTDTEVDDLPITPWEAENFDRTKCSVTVRLLDMISAILKSSEPHCLPSSLLNLQLWQLIIDCVMHPCSLGFDLCTTEVLDCLPKNLIELLKVLQQSLPSSKTAEFNSELRKAISSTQTDVFSNLQDSLRNDKVTLEQKQLLQGLEILHRCGMLNQIKKELPNQCGLDGKQIVKDLFSALAEGQGDMKRAVVLQPTAFTYAESLLKFAFLLNKEVSAVACCMKDQARIQNPATHLPVLHGEHFFVTFRSAILEHMLAHSEHSVNSLVQDISPDNVQWVITILTELLQYYAKNIKKKHGDSTVICTLQRSIVNHWNRLCSLVEGNSEQIYQLLGLVFHLARMIPQPIGGLAKYEALQKWVITQLSSSHLQLHYKCRALDLLACLTGPQDVDNEQLRTALLKLREQHFPQLSTELHSGTLEYSSFVHAFRKILQGLEGSGSCVLLLSVVAMSASESQHVCEDRIQQSLQTFIKRALKYRSETLSDNLTGATHLVELFRQSQCAAFNALVAIISNVKRELKFYAGLLFVGHKEVLWEKLVDCRKEYFLVLDWEEIPTRRKQLVSIRCQARAHRKEISSFASESVHYIPSASQCLFDSTLNEDVTLFDFSTSVVRNETIASHDGKALEEQPCSDSTEVSLETDDLNRHECMAILCGVIKHMVDQGISPAPGAETKDAVLPSWMESVRKCLADSSRHRNVRLFLLKLVLNVESKFRPYAHHWVNCLLKVVVDGVAGRTPNYLLSDTVALLVDWCSKITSLPAAAERHQVSQLLDLLIRNVHHDRRDVFKHNLELIRTVVELWKPNFDIPHQVLYDMIMIKDRKDSTASEPGIQVSAIILANHLEPWSSTGKLQFLTAVLRNLDSDKRSVYQSSAEVSGMALGLLDSNGNGMLEGDDSEIHSRLTDKLRFIKDKSKDKFLVCLFAVQEHYPRIVDMFMKHVLFHLPRTYGEFRVMCLKIAYSRLEILGDEIYAEMKSKDLLKTLNDRDPDQQNLALQMVHKMVHKLKPDQLKELIQEVCKSEIRRNVECRKVMYEILKWIYDHCQDVGGKLIEETKSTLLKGLTDDDPHLRDDIFKYWNNDAQQREAATSVRLLFILTDLYCPSTEHQFLGYSTQFLLEATVGTPDYNRKMFSEPLQKCQFEDFRMLLSWRAQHAMIAPMFADTLASQLIQSQSLSSTGESTGAEPLLRATQASLAFQPTLEQGGSSIGSLPSFSKNSSLLFTTSSSGEKQRKSYKMGPGFGSHKLKLEPEVSDEVDSNVDHFTPNLRRRFLRHDYQKRIFHASQEVQRSARRQELEQERGRRHEANIASFRKYRSGDFPDIEIPYCAVIRPMQELAKRDTTIARQLFVLLFEGLLEELHDEKNVYTKKVQEAMSSILSTTKDYTAMVMGTVMEIALHHGKYIVLQPEDIATASQASGLLAMGCLLLEENLILRDAISEDGPSKRSKTLEPSTEQNYWLILADLYKNMDEWDVVRGIFQKHLNYDENIHRALQWEISGNWYNARKEYEAALSSMDGDNILTDYYIEAMYKCLAHLTDWENLNKQVRYQIEDNFDKLWEDDWLKEQLLPKLLLSEVQLMLDKGVEGIREQQFLQQVDGWLKDKDRFSYLSRQYCEELAAIFLIQDNVARAQHQVECSLTAFLNSWSELNPLSHKLRTKQLLDVQKTAELQACLAFATGGEHSKRELLAKDLVRRWSKNIPSVFDSLLCWDIKAMYRKKFTGQIDQILENGDASNALNSMNLAMVDSALYQENFNVANKYLLQSKEKVSRSGTDLGLRWNLANSKALWLKGQCMNTPDKKLKSGLFSWNVIDPLVEDQRLEQYPMLHVDILQHVSVLATGILQLLEQQPSVLAHLPADDVKKLADRIRAPDCSEDQLKHHLKQHGLGSLKRSAELVTPTCSSEQAVAKAYLQVAEYCRAHSDISLEEDNFGTDIVVSILRAMRYGSKDARQLFPCLLRLHGLHTHLSELFHKESTEVPVWMFLGWVNQLLSCLDTAVGPVLHSLVLRLAETYPQALIYAFKLSVKNYNLGSGHETLKALADRLASLLFADPMFDTFLRAFSCLGQPCKMLFYFVDKLEKLLNAETPNCDHLCHTYDTMMKELFPCSDENIHGAVFQQVKEYKIMLEKAGSRIKGGDKRGIKDLGKIKKRLGSVIQNLKPPTQLKDYSPWLSEFQAGKHSSLELEIPGQYTGESKPLIQHHIKIAGFKQTVEHQNSKTLPLRVTIFGNDAKEHQYLVKFGEDLRQDQRLEQLFILMNKILHQDPACRQRSLSIATYQVVPLTTHLGIIQWVDGTKGLKDLMLGVLDQSEMKMYKMSHVEYMRWISEAARAQKGDYKEQYGGAHMKYSRDETNVHFRKMVNMVPWDIMRHALQNLSTSPELYFTLRQNFACSHAVLCIAHWLLGIGDRHLSNTLVSMKDGQCVGIDFGYAFGTATQFLPVPELMPFRLTPHIVNLLQPQDETGLFRETMVHCLRALRNNCHMLLATMEVFVQEPSIDWLEFASKHESLNKDTHEESQTWYPQQKLDLAKEKLEGANPVAITTEELKAGFNKSEYLEKFLECVKGHNSVRAKMPSHNLSPEEQVDCLLDQATDPNVLGKTWVGWESWM
ncbi:DNA-dependent protein kinase catalytic subunit-like isoform X3 [Zootermopsis nevadensis]|uniref:DNA-dependent protein kinase catalytic subunit-like isoform X3 n=1 Tax=Zootermopsis nevadensis TaxID=136037 RepID=UPI000B8EAF6F|nr:DNA-dependent protein kinase catalytic subunit-like isoform X3 [Zootermopsis nevadensis]